MRNDLADITVILDRSGSMASCKEEAENGLNHFIDEQKTVPGSALFTLVQFDTEYEFVHRGADIRSVGHHALVPRGMTALLDAVGRAINEAGERLNAIPEADRPGLVVFVILTDGQENSSHEFNLTQLKKMIEHQRNVYRWQFTFLGANQDAFAEAGAMGIQSTAAANYDAAAPQAAFHAAHRNVTRMRVASAEDAPICNAYTDDERSEMA